MTGSQEVSPSLKWFLNLSIWAFNPYLRHFGNAMESHLWTKNPQPHFWFWWRHLVLYATWSYHVTSSPSDIMWWTQMYLKTRENGGESFVDKKSTAIFYQKNFCWIVLEGEKMLFEFFKKNLCGFFFHKWRSTIFPCFLVHLCSSHDLSGYWRHVIRSSGVQLLLLKRFQINIK